MRRREDAGRGLHKPCLASEADTWSASVDSWGGSVMLMLPEDETVLSCCGESSSETISAPWSVRALADSRKLSLWLSICGGRGDRGGRGHSRVHNHNRLHWPSLATLVQSKTKAESEVQQVVTVQLRSVQIQCRYTQIYLKKYIIDKYCMEINRQVNKLADAAGYHAWNRYKGCCKGGGRV